MEKGDLSNEVVPRLLVVFEGLLGYLPDTTTRAKFAVECKFHRWKQALNCFVVNERMARLIVDAAWRYKYAVDVVTFLGEEFDELLPPLLDDRWQLPIGNCWAEDPTVLARRLAYAPTIAGVFHAMPDLQHTFGSKGVLVDPNHPHLISQYR